MPRTIDPELPWGYWLRLEKQGYDLRYVDDRNGAEWKSLRAAFWSGRMGMPSEEGDAPERLLEVLHAILAILSRRQIKEYELAGDLFEGNRIASEMFVMWLRVSGMIVPVTRDSRPNYDLSVEGASVLLMLTATRPDSVKGARPASATVAQLADIGRGIEDRDRRLFEIERASSQWNAAFLRRKEAGKPAVVFSTRGEGPMPVLQTVWALRFDTTDERDTFYDWLCQRIERWQAWSELTSSFGAKDLTRKLLSVMAASLRDGGAAKTVGAVDQLLLTQR